MQIQVQKDLESLQSHDKEDWVTLFYQVNNQSLFAFNQIGLDEITKIIYSQQDDANRVAIPSALTIVKIHNTNVTKESDLIKDFSPYLPYASRFQLQQLLAEIPDVSRKAAKDFMANESFLKKRVQRAFARIRPALKYLAEK
ncbi:MAG: hypothetical protein RLZZ171_1406 [Cyanobacteriota bacterium]